MQEDIGEELLTLGLSINSSWHSNSAKKRKRTGESETYNHHLFTMLQTRNAMFEQLEPRIYGLEHGKGLQLVHLLLVSATAIDGNDTSSAINSLTELYQNVSVIGDPIQRVTAYFADALAASLLTKNSPFYNEIIANPTPVEEFSAFTHLYRASPYYQFAHFTANQVIIEAFEEEAEKTRSLHVIDFDVSYGFQWPSLIQSLSDKATTSRPLSLRITGFGQSMEELQAIQIRLANFARGCRNLSFKFVGLLQGFGSSNIEIKKDETLVVNLVFYLQSLRSSDVISETLSNVYLLNPSLVVLVEKEGSQAPRSFLSRFMESLHYFEAMFDSLDDCLPAESTVRLSIEKNHLGKEIKEVVTSKEKGEDLRYGRLESWKERMERNRFEGVKLSSRSVIQAKLLLKIKSHCSTADHGNSGGFQIFESDEGRALSLGWQDRHLIAATAWRCVL